MQTNATLQTLVNKLSLVVPDWKEVERKYHNSARLLCPDVPKALAETYLVTALEKIIAQEKLPVQFSQLENERVGTYTFSRSSGRILVSYKNDEPRELGELLVVDGLLVLFKMKSGTWRRRGLHHDSDCSRGAYSAFVPSVYEPQLAALQALSGKDPGYVVCLPAQKLAMDGDLITTFLTKGGHIAQLSVDRQTFREGMQSVRAYYDI